VVTIEGSIVISKSISRLVIIKLKIHKHVNNKIVQRYLW